MASSSPTKPFLRQTKQKEIHTSGKNVAHKRMHSNASMLFAAGCSALLLLLQIGKHGQSDYMTMKQQRRFDCFMPELSMRCWHNCRGTCNAKCSGDIAVTCFVTNQ
jgi:hypothetical protein